MKEPSENNLSYKYNIGELLSYDINNIYALNKEEYRHKLVYVINKEIKYSHVNSDYEPSYFVLVFPENKEYNIFERHLAPYQKGKNEIQT